jgi:hypothetical protein
MPHPNSSTAQLASAADFTTKCHYTLRLYTCTHKSFLPVPRITHVRTCPNYVPSNPTLSDHSPTYLLNASKHRCNNMASKPKEIHLSELCSKCRPYSLGVEKQLRDFETLVTEENVPKREEGEERHTSRSEMNSSIGWGVSSDEIERVVNAPTQTGTLTQSAPEPPFPPPLSLKIPESEPILEQPSDSSISTDTPGKRERWVGVCPSVENGEAASSLNLTKRGGGGLFSKIFKPRVSGKSEEVKTMERVKEDNIEEEGKGSGKGWVSVKDDPDWEALSAEEREEKTLWKDDGEWVNVKQ